MNEIKIHECSARELPPLMKYEMSPSQQAGFIEGISETGINEIECVSFIHPRLVPNIPKAETVMAKVKKKHGVIYSGVAPSEIACRRALSTNIDEIIVSVAASEKFNRLLLGLDIKTTLNKTLPAILKETHKYGKSTRAYIWVAFGCPYRGEFAQENIIEIVYRLSYLGVRKISLLDNPGLAHPKKVKSIIRKILNEKMDISLAVHFHNTRGIAMANAFAAYEEGVYAFDTSIAGISRTPFATPKSDIEYWNIPTEDMINMFNQMDISSGIDFDKLMRCVEKAEKLMGQKLPGHILRAGDSKRKFNLPKNLPINYK